MPIKSSGDRLVLDTGSVIASLEGETLLSVPTETGPFEIYITFDAQLENRFSGRPRDDGGMNLMIGTKLFNTLGGGITETEFGTFSGKRAYFQFRFYVIGPTAAPLVSWTITSEK